MCLQLCGVLDESTVITDTAFASIVHTYTPHSTHTHKLNNNYPEI